MSSVIYNLSGTDKTLILDTRAQLIQPFDAGNWTDLRLTMAASITKESDPNDPTSLGETIGTGEDLHQFFLGFKASDSFFPGTSNFFGVSTRRLASLSAVTVLLAGAGFNNVYQNSDNNLYFLISDGTNKQNSSSLTGIRFQNAISMPTNAGYATILMLQMLRNDPTVNQVDSSLALINSNYFDNGVPFDTDTSIAHLRELTAAASFTQQFPSFTFSKVPDAIFAYWPFTNSRLRIHSYVLERYA